MGITLKHGHHEPPVIGWFRGENGSVVTAAVIQHITKDKLLVEDITDCHRRYEINQNYFYVTPMVHGNA